MRHLLEALGSFYSYEVTNASTGNNRNSNNSARPRMSRSGSHRSASLEGREGNHREEAESGMSALSPQSHLSYRDGSLSTSGNANGGQDDHVSILQLPAYVHRPTPARVLSEHELVSIRSVLLQMVYLLLARPVGPGESLHPAVRR